jgi:hypothetical protein
VVAASAILVARRTAIMLRTQEAGKNWAGAMLVLALALLCVTAGFEAKHQWVQSRATAVVAHTSGVPAGVAQCQRFTGDLADVSVFSGFVSSDDTETAKLRRDVCDDLFSWLVSDKTNPSIKQVVAVHVAVHEAMHVGGEFDESKAECEAMQADADAAVFLGATPTQGRVLMETYFAQVYPRMPAEYSSAACVADGAFDLTPGDGLFP